MSGSSSEHAAESFRKKMCTRAEEAKNVLKGVIPTALTVNLLPGSKQQKSQEEQQK